MERTTAKLLKSLMNHEFFMEKRGGIVPEMFDGEAKGIFRTICAAHEKYGKNLGIDDVDAVHQMNHPTTTAASWEQIRLILAQINSFAPFTREVADDLVRHVFAIHVWHKVTDYALDGLDKGSDLPIQPLMDMLKKHEDGFTPELDIEFLANDLDSIMTEVEEQYRWQFNLPALSEMLPGMGGGDLMVIFARPEVGKTAMHVSLAASEGGWISQGAKVHVIGNEEKSSRTHFRAVSSALGMTREEIFDGCENGHKDLITAKWAAALAQGDYQVPRDVSGMTVEGLDHYCKVHKPDILVVDQLDKVGCAGTFAREDQRLRRVYQQMRETAKRHDCLVVAMSQASANADGKMTITYNDMDESKTGKAAEADVILGIGARAPGSEGDMDVRGLTLSKNKKSGVHGTTHCRLNAPHNRYES